MLDGIERENGNVAPWARRLRDAESIRDRERERAENEYNAVVIGVLQECLATGRDWGVNAVIDYLEATEGPLIRKALVERLQGMKRP